jgi:hypothetical protein
VSVLTAGFVIGRRFGWRALKGRRIGRGRLGGIGRILIEPCFQFGEASFVSLDQSPDSVLSGWRDLQSQFFRDWRVRTHAAGLSIQLRPGNLDP